MNFKRLKKERERREKKEKGKEKEKEKEKKVCKPQEEIKNSLYKSPPLRLFTSNILFLLGVPVRQYNT